MITTGKKVVENALKYKSYAYWYGGKGQKCTEKLLYEMASLYPSIYTTAYKEKCQEDIKAGKKCIDCSGLVCKAYEIDDIGTYQMVTDARLTIWDGAPKNGMIVWRWTHCGIYTDGYVIEARGKSYGVTTTRKYKSSDWQRIYYMSAVNYDTEKTPTQILQAAIDVIAGKYGVGNERVNALKKAGYNADKVQKIVNEVLK